MSKQHRIHKARGLETEFVILRNKDVQRADLSYEAVGMLVYLMSLPEDWTIYVNNLKRKGHAGRDKVKRILAELETNGYLYVIQNTDEDSPRNEGGKFSANVYEAYAMPEYNPHYNSPLTEKPLTDEPLTVDQQLQSKELDKENKDKVPAATQEAEKSDIKIQSKQRDRLFDGIAYLCFGININDDSSMVKQSLKVAGGRIGKIKKYLTSLDEPPTPEQLYAFSKWYDQKYQDADMPRDVGKFAEHWLAYVQDSKQQANADRETTEAQALAKAQMDELRRLEESAS